MAPLDRDASVISIVESVLILGFAIVTFVLVMNGHFHHCHID